MTHTVRRVLPLEYHKYRTHLKSLDSESKFLRFGYHISDEIVDQLCDNIDKHPDQHVLFCIENDRLEFVAVGHIALQDGMELAFSVLKSAQGQGMGNALMKRCIQHCRTRGILKGCMVCLSSNAAIRHLCVKHGIHIHNDHGETLADVELDQPNITTYMAEATDANIATIDYLGKRMRRTWTFKPD